MIGRRDLEDFEGRMGEKENKGNEKDMATEDK